MKAYLLPIMLQALGFAVVVAEVFIPSLGVLSVVAFGVIAYSLFLVYTTISPEVFWIFLGCDLLVLPLVLVLGLKALSHSPLALKKKLSSHEGVVSQSPNLETHLNKEGKTLTPLRPSGTAEIEGLRLDVVTDGDYMEAGVKIKVAQVTGNQIIVQRSDE